MNQKVERAAQNSKDQKEGNGPCQSELVCHVDEILGKGGIVHAALLLVFLWTSLSPVLILKVLTYSRDNRDKHKEEVPRVDHVLVQPGVTVQVVALHLESLEEEPEEPRVLPKALVLHWRGVQGVSDEGKRVCLPRKGQVVGSHAWPVDQHP